MHACRQAGRQAGRQFTSSHAAFPFRSEKLTRAFGARARSRSSLPQCLFRQLLPKPCLRCISSCHVIAYHSIPCRIIQYHIVSSCPGCVATCNLCCCLQPLPDEQPDDFHVHQIAGEMLLLQGMAIKRMYTHLGETYFANVAVKDSPYAQPMKSPRMRTHI